MKSFALNFILSNAPQLVFFNYLQSMLCETQLTILLAGTLSLRGDPDCKCTRIFNACSKQEVNEPSNRNSRAIQKLVSTKLCMYCICSDIYEIVHNSQKLFDKSFPGRIKAENPKLKLLSRIWEFDTYISDAHTTWVPTAPQCSRLFLSSLHAYIIGKGGRWNCSVEELLLY